MAHLYDQLTKALLLEMGSGAYQERDRFLSYRKVCKLFGVSLPTAKTAFGRLLDEGLLKVEDRSGIYLQPHFRQKALFLLKKLDEVGHCDPLLPPLKWRYRWASFSASASTRPLVAVFPFSASRRPIFFREPPPFLSGVLNFCAKGFYAEARRKETPILFATQRLSHPGYDANLLVERCVKLNAGGVVYFHWGHTPKFQEQAQRLVDEGIPVLRAFDHCHGMSIFSLNYNNVAIGYDAVTALASRGHQKVVALIASTVADRASNDRITGARIAQEEHRLELDVVAVEFEKPHTLDDFLRTRPDVSAFFLANSWIVGPLRESLSRLWGTKAPFPDVVLCTARRNSPAYRDCYGFYLDFEVLGREALSVLKRVADGEAVSKSILLPPSHFFRPTNCAV